MASAPLIGSVWQYFLFQENFWNVEEESDDKWHRRSLCIVQPSFYFRHLIGPCCTSLILKSSTSYNKYQSYPNWHLLDWSIFQSTFLNNSLRKNNVFIFSNSFVWKFILFKVETWKQWHKKSDICREYRSSWSNSASKHISG